MLKSDELINKVKSYNKFLNPETLTKAYNSASFLTGAEEINTDLKSYITERAITGLFKLVEEEEMKIRKDPIARVTDVLKKVFGSLD